MDAQKAIEAHRAWKDRLRSAMATRERLDVAVIGADDCCEFGKWLHGEGKAMLGTSPLYGECLALHARFHAEAAEVAKQVNEGDLLSADRMLAHGTSYSRASEEMIVGVIAMFGAN